MKLNRQLANCPCWVSGPHPTYVGQARLSIAVLSWLLLAGCGQLGYSGGAIDGNAEKPVDSGANAKPAPTIYAHATLDDGASIKAPNRCSATIGAGGNLTEPPYVLKGKCNGAGTSPTIVEDLERSNYLSFTVDPSESVAGERDRAELAYTRNFPFYEEMHIGFRLMIPPGTDISDEFFYALQLWQCAGQAPIAGVRMARGQSHTINFMTRNEIDGKSRAHFELVPGQWHAFALTVSPDPVGPALFRVYADGRLLVESFARYGFGADDACGKAPNKYEYRVKFGIYKGGEPGRQFKVNYDDFVIADSLEAVTPW